MSNFNLERSTFNRFELEFEGPGGDQVAAKTDVGRTAPVKIGGLDDLIHGSSLGQHVSLPVVHDPDHPKRVDIEAVSSLMRPEKGALASSWVMWVIVGVFAGAGLAFMVTGGGDPMCSDPDVGRPGFCDGFGR